MVETLLRFPFKVLIAPVFDLSEKNTVLVVVFVDNRISERPTYRKDDEGLAAFKVTEFARFRLSFTVETLLNT